MKSVRILQTSYSFRFVSFKMWILILADSVSSVALNDYFDFIVRVTKEQRMSVITAEVV